MGIGVHTDKDLAEQLLIDVFEQLLIITQLYGITTKRAAELLMSAQVTALEKQGVSRVNIRPLSGLSAKTVRKLANHGHGEDETDLLATFISDWNSDSSFPNTLFLDASWPSFLDLCDKYGRDLTPAAISNGLESRGLVKKVGNKITLLKDNLISNVGDPDLVHLASDALQDLISTIGNNLSGKTPLMQRRMYTYRIPESSMEELRSEMREAVNDLRGKAREILRKYESGDDQGVDVGIGLYEFIRPRKR